MINIIIFSSDKTLQLEILLKSINLNFKTESIHIIYKGSDNEFGSGYTHLKQKYNNVKWIKQDVLKEQLIDVIKKDNFKYTCFFTDDNYIYDNINNNDILKWFDDDDIFCFSLRLGENIKKCYVLGCENILNAEYKDDKFVKWNWTKRYADFSQPLSLDGHIFRTKDIQKMIKSLTFDNYEELEENLQVFDNYPRDYMVSYLNSKSIVLNNKSKYDNKQLNDKLLSGKSICIDNIIEIDNIDSCVKDINFKIN
jgi:hypothetical protein